MMSLMLLMGGMVFVSAVSSCLMDVPKRMEKLERFLYTLCALITAMLILEVLSLTM